MEWTQRLRMRQLYLLVALYENRNVSHTAARMGVTQPGLSKWLGELEEDLNVKLFKRGPRGLEPTDYCAALVQHARAIIGELDRTQTTIRLLSNGITGNLVVGTTPTVATGVVPRAAHLLGKRHPDAFLRLVEDRLDLLMPQLLEGRMDFVVTRTDQARLEPGLRCDLLYPEHIRIVVGPQHPLARKRKLAWADVMRYPWITPPKTSPIRRELEHELALAGQPTPRYRVESGSTLVILSMLQDGDLVAPMSGRLMESFHKNHQLVPLPLPYLREGSVGVIRRLEAVETPLHKAFMEGLLQAARG
ncbi:LysR family transcriptional regulator [Hydrogenophaga sp. OTU3427]|uniref:LysR family transcriptional regulator n=1 Tax=Hydrogenophaga sp. OTU3427 TaxID=3043856 RepID=UPI00313AFD65